MKKYIFSGLLLMASASVFAQMQVNKQIQMTGATTDDRRITNISNASAVTPVNTDAVNIATFQSNYTNYGAGAFATGTYTVALIPATTVYWDGMIVSFKAGAVNTGATSLAVNLLAAQAIVKAGGQALVAGDIQANQMVTVVYNLGSTRFEIIGSVGIPGWSTLGNIGTTFGTSFLGTTDATSLDIRTNNTEKIRITSNGQVSINNANNAYAFTTLFVQNASTTNRVASFTGVYDGIRGTSTSATATDGFAIWGISFGGGPGVFGRNGSATNTSFIPNSGGGFSTTVSDALGTRSVGVTGSTSFQTGLTTRFGGYFSFDDLSTPAVANTYAYVGGRNSSGVDRKIEGTGTVNTVVKDVNNKLIVLSAPEAPENLFMDYGAGKLVNGKVKIILDPNFAKNIIVNEKHPLRVIIQLEGECNGVFVTNKTPNSFEVIELQKGTSNTAFTYQIVGNRADDTDIHGIVIPYSTERFAPAIGPAIKSVKTENKAEGK